MCIDQIWQSILPDASKSLNEGKKFGCPRNEGNKKLGSPRNEGNKTIKNEINEVGGGGTR